MDRLRLRERGDLLDPRDQLGVLRCLHPDFVAPGEQRGDNQQEQTERAQRLDHGPERRHDFHLQQARLQQAEDGAVAGGDEPGPGHDREAPAREEIRDEHIR